MSGSAEASVTRKVITYLHDRNRILRGGWVSVADIRGTLGADLEDVRSACLTLHRRNIAELMGGFPIQPTTDKFTLVRLNDEGTRVAADAGELDRIFGGGESGEEPAGG